MGVQQGFEQLIGEVQDGALLGKEYITIEDEAVDEEQGAAEQGDDAYVQAAFYLSSFFIV